MKRVMCTSLMVLLLGVAFLNGCGEKAEETAKKAADKAKEAAGAAKEAATETAKSAAVWTKEKMDAYTADMKSQMGKLDKQFEDLGAKADKLAGDSKEKYNKNAADVTEKKQAIATKMKELEGASGDAWEKAKQELDKLMSELAELYENIKKDFSAS